MNEQKEKRYPMPMNLKYMLAPVCVDDISCFHCRKSFYDCRCDKPSYEKIWVDKKGFKLKLAGNCGGNK